MTQLTLKVNGQSVSKDVAPQTLLVEFLRETLRLTGTHVGCDTARPTARCTRCKRRSAPATACSAASARQAW
jgi:aerobic carbon-monoxide dehydrogenase small subunit